MPRKVQPAPALVLFDIDGTLIRRAGSHHKDCLVDAIQRVSGYNVAIDGVPTAGMLDRDIAASMMRASGATAAEIKAAMPEVVRRAQLLYARRCPSLESKLCPGVQPALGRLRDAGVLLGLVTGNFSRIGWKKMEQAGLREYFRFGAFAEMGTTRAGLVKVARQQARASGWIAPNAPVTLIGDHPNDVLAARLNRIRSIAVATGVIDRSALEAAGPDILLRDLRLLRPEMVF